MSNAQENQLKLSTLVNVRAFGAKGDGVTDDTAAIQAAINAAVSAGSGVYVPPGTYLTSASLTVDVASAFAIYGDGYKSCIKGAAAGTYILLLVQRTGYTAVNQFALRGVRFDGNAGGQLDAGLVVLNNVDGFVMDHCWVENGTRVSGASGVNGVSVSAGNPGGTGPLGTISNCLIRNTSKAGVNVTTEARGVAVVNNILRDIVGNGTAPGIQINGAAGCRVIGNYITNTEGPGIYIAVDGSGNQPLDTVVQGNVVKACGATSATIGDGIRATAVSSYNGRLVISGNTLADNGTNTNGGSGIYLINTGNVVVEGNIARNNRYDGIRVQGCSHVALTGNRCTGNNLAAVSFAGGIQILGTCDNVSVVGNHCSDDKTVKTQSYGVILTSGAVLTDLTVVSNHLAGNSAGPVLLNAGAKPMTLEYVAEKQTTDGAAQTASYITLPDTSAAVVRVTGVGKQSDASNRALYSREGLFYRNGGTATQQGASTTLGTDIESDATWGGVGLAVSANLAVVQVTGKAATTIDWRAQVSVQTV